VAIIDVSPFGVVLNTYTAAALGLRRRDVGRLVCLFGVSSAVVVLLASRSPNFSMATVAQAGLPVVLAPAVAGLVICLAPRYTMTIRVLIADDHGLVREGFRLVLERESDIEVVADVSDGAQAVAAAQSLQPDVVLMDIRMPNMDGIQATRTILDHTDGEPPIVVVLTTFDLDEYVYAALHAGATGFLLKDVPPEQLVTAVRTARSGDALFSPTPLRTRGPHPLLQHPPIPTTQHLHPRAGHTRSKSQPCNLRGIY
jgi:DNA-binding NarL/FixJ family response regulator